MKPSTRSHTVSPGARPAASRPLQKVATNHARSHRSGSPRRVAASALGAHARAHSSSIDLRCASRSRQPMSEPESASRSYVARGTLAAYAAWRETTTSGTRSSWHRR